MAQVKPLVIANTDLLNPPSGRFWFFDEQFPKDHKDLYEKDDKKGRPIPNYSPGEVAKFFFGKTAQWLRWRYESDAGISKVTGEKLPGRHPNGFFVLDGIPLQPKVSPQGQRYYTIADIERMAHALAQNGVINGVELSEIIQMLQLTVKIWKKGRRHA